MSAIQPLPAVCDEAALRDESIGLPRELIRIDRSNPPGNETAAGQLLAEYLGGFGVECELVARDPDPQLPHRDLPAALVALASTSRSLPQGLCRP